jgi:UDP-N-acetylmuramoylalanine-D-glutamate ligase
VLNISNKNLLNKKITIIGLKKSGYAATILGHELGANIFVSEIDNDLEVITNKNNLIKKGIDVETGNHSKLVYDADFWVISPGVPNDIEITQKSASYTSFEWFPVSTSIPFLIRLFLLVITSKSLSISLTNIFAPNSCPNIVAA